MTNRLPILVNKSPEEGYDLALKLNRMAVKKAQPEIAIRGRLRADDEADAQALDAVSQTVAVNFAKIAAVKCCWSARAGAERT